jgi:hypothetical protein
VNFSLLRFFKKTKCCSLTQPEKKNDMTLQSYKRLLDTSRRLCQPDQTRPGKTRPERTKISDCFGADYRFKCQWSNFVSHPRDGEVCLVYVRTIILRVLSFASLESRRIRKASCLDTDYCGVFRTDCEKYEWEYYIKTQFTQQIWTYPSFYCQLC